MSLVLHSNENSTVAIGAVDSTARPVTVAFDAGSVVVTVSDVSVLETVVAPDELSVLVKALGPVATSVVVTVSGSVGGVALTAATLDVDVVPAPAVAVTLAPGAPVAN